MARVWVHFAKAGLGELRFPEIANAGIIGIDQPCQCRKHDQSGGDQHVSLQHKRRRHALYRIGQIVSL